MGYYANSEDPVQTPPNAASVQSLHCFLTKKSMTNVVKMKHPPEAPDTKNGFIQRWGCASQLFKKVSRFLKNLKINITVESTVTQDEAGMVLE